MNATWRLPSPDLDERFIAEAAASGLTELKGHRSVGGIRASLYNAMPTEGAQALAGFMRSFASSTAA
jgi:phosphoserine aminotransferase